MSPIIRISSLRVCEINLIWLRRKCKNVEFVLFGRLVKPMVKLQIIHKSLCVCMIFEMGITFSKMMNSGNVWEEWQIIICTLRHPEHILPRPSFRISQNGNMILFGVDSFSMWNFNSLYRLSFSSVCHFIAIKSSNFSLFCWLFIFKSSAFHKISKLLSLTVTH